MTMRSGFFVVPESQVYRLPTSLTGGIKHRQVSPRQSRTYHPIFFIGSLIPDYIGSTIIAGSIDFSRFPIGSSAIVASTLITRSAQIANGIIGNAQVGTLNASVITTGTLIAINSRIGTQSSIFKTDARGLYMGNEHFGSAPFRVDPSGNLRAQSGKFIGSLIVGTPNGLIQSDNYSPGTAGFQLHPTAGLKIYSGEITTPAFRQKALTDLATVSDSASVTSSETTIATTTYNATGKKIVAWASVDIADDDSDWTLKLYIDGNIVQTVTITMATGEGQSTEANVALLGSRSVAAGNRVIHVTGQKTGGGGITASANIIALEFKDQA